MAAPTMQVQITQREDAVVVKLVGELRLDVEAAGMQIDRGVIVHKPRLVVVDCSELQFLSSIGMSLLVNLRNSVTRAGGQVRLAGLNPLVEGALRHASLHLMFKFCPTVEQAIAPVIQ